MIKIGFLTTLGFNVGDEFIRQGLRAVLDRSPTPYAPLYVNKVDRKSVYRPAQDEDETVSDKFFDCDLFLQSGAPVYWNLKNGATSLTSEWHQWMWLDRILATNETTGPIFANLGAGSCQAWNETAADFLADPACVDFARHAHARARLTTVRDPVAKGILDSLGCSAEGLACPAFLAAARSTEMPARSGVIGVNYMALGGHYDLEGGFSETEWAARIDEMLDGLRRLGRLWFIAHDTAEVAFQQKFAQPGESIFYSNAWRDYLDVYGSCSLVVANRVHGAVAAAGFGVPAVILGSDTRAQIGDYLGLPRFHSRSIQPSAVIEQSAALLARRKEESLRLLDLRTNALNRYQELLRPLIEEATLRAGRTRASRPSAGPSARRAVATPVIAQVAELESPRFRAFMKDINSFAAARGLREFTDWSKVWEYPWLWQHGLTLLDWPRLRVLDLGSELSPFPWYLADLGATVTLVEFDGQWQPLWQKLSAIHGNRVDWHIANSEKIPVADESIDVVTSFSVIEHQPDKSRAIDEVVRVLKPGGIFAVSFDICEPDRGMTFPAWNGQALTLREFEEIVWRHPAFGNDQPLSWNTEDMAAFKAWNLKSASHHNYVVGAAILRKLA